LRVVFVQRLFFSPGLSVHADSINEAVSRGDEKKPAQLVGILEASAGFTEVAHLGKIGPVGL
jgi:hypothetical protein